MTIIPTAARTLNVVCVCVCVCVCDREEETLELIILAHILSALTLSKGMAEIDIVMLPME